MSIPTLRKLSATLDATVVFEFRWRGAALDRLLDEDHARLVARVVEVLTVLNWETRVEVTYSEFGERGSYDVLAWHATTRTLLVIEVKTDLPSGEATVRKLDEKTRLARKIGRDQFGWQVSTVARVLVLADESTLRRRIDRHHAYFATALPIRGAALRAWLRRPQGSVAAVWFLSASDTAAVIQRRGGHDRVRRPKQGVTSDAVAK